MLYVHYAESSSGLWCGAKKQSFSLEYMYQVPGTVKKKGKDFHLPNQPTKI